MNGKLSEQNEVIKKLQEDIAKLQEDIASKDKTIEEIYSELQKKIKELEDCSNKLEEKFEEQLEESSGIFGVLNIEIKRIFGSLGKTMLQMLFYVFIGIGCFVLLKRFLQRKVKPTKPTEPNPGGSAGNQPDPVPPPSPPNYGLCEMLLDAWSQFEERLFDRLEKWLEDHTPVCPEPVVPDPGPSPPDPTDPGMPPVDPFPIPDPSPVEPPVEPPIEPPAPDEPDPPPTSSDNPLDHPDFIEPPGVVVPPRQYEPDYGKPLYPKAPNPFVRPGNPRKYLEGDDFQPVTGYGPIPPNMPASKYDATQVLAAVDELSRRHSMDDRLSTVSQLVRQILNEPQRKRKGE